jgi:amidase
MKDKSCFLSRRELLAIASTGIISNAIPPCKSNPKEGGKPERISNDKLTLMSATALARAIRNKQLSSEEVVNAHLIRIQRVNPKINAIVQILAEQALAEARAADRALAKGEKVGALHGVPMTIKDSLDTAGVITTAGTKGREKFVPTEDATVVKRLRQAGAILLGKTNTPELTLAGETDNLVYGRTNNPYDLSRSPGGSSGGAVAIIACGGSPFDIGSDTVGSIRFPCSFCGVTGIKPTSGRVPRTGHIISYEMGYMESYTQLGPIARKVEDLSLLLPIISGPDWRDPYTVPASLGRSAAVELKKLRVSFHDENGVTATAGVVRDVVRKAAKVIESNGTVVEESRPPGIEEFFADKGASDGGALFRSILQGAGTTEASPLLKGAVDPTQQSSSAAELEAYLVRIARFRSRMLAFMERYDAIVCPTFGQPVPPHGYYSKIRFPSDYSYTMTYNVTGWPAVVVRGGTSPDGLPIGVQIVARPFREEVALRVAAEIEAVLGGFKPPNAIAD